MQESVIPKQQLYRLVFVDTWWYRVSIEWYWLVLGGTGSVDGGTRSPRKFDLYQSVYGGTGWYLVVLGQ